MSYQSTKTYGNHIGISAAFRQWKAHSHCQLIHGYALGFKFVFEADELDERNWVVDFGGLKALKGILEDTFDHKVVVAEDDPHLDYFRQGHDLGVLKMVVVPAGGCEKFAELVYGVTEQWMKESGVAPRVRLVSVEVMEHGANSAIYTGKL
jgi:6-pyruvoyltetrahydropterin/6-carboxytetrahydropterin synthase